LEGQKIEIGERGATEVVSFHCSISLKIPQQKDEYATYTGVTYQVRKGNRLYSQK